MFAADKPFGADIESGPLKAGMTVHKTATVHADDSEDVSSKHKKKSKKHESSHKKESSSQKKMKRKSSKIVLEEAPINNAQSSSQPAETKHESSEDERTLLGNALHVIGGGVKFLVHGLGYVVHLRNTNQNSSPIIADSAHESSPIVPVNADAENIIARGLPTFQNIFTATQKGVESFATIIALLEEWSQRTRGKDENSMEHLVRIIKEFQGALGKKMMKTTADQSDLLGTLSKVNVITPEVEQNVPDELSRGLLIDIGSGIVNAADNAVDFVSQILENRLGALRTNLLNGTTEVRVDTFFDTVENVIDTTTKISPLLSSALVVYPPAAAAFNVLMTGVNMYGTTLNSQEKAADAVIDMLKKRVQNTQIASGSIQEAVLSDAT